MPSIYGDDETGMASEVASKALRGSGAPDAHGPIRQSEANSKGGAGAEPGDVTVTKHGTGRDKRVDSCGNHGCNK